MFSASLARLARLRFRLQRRILGEGRRNLVARAVALPIGRREFTGPSMLPPDHVAGVARTLTVDGYAPLGRLLSPQDLTAVHAALAGKPCHDAYATGPRVEFPIEEAPESCVNAYYRWQDVIRVAPLLRAANDPGVLAAVQDFLGATPTISDINLWWSVLRGGRGKENQLFHRDVDDLKFCKLFIYLTDVDEESGPHVYVRGSSASRECLPIRRYPDQMIRETFGDERAITICGEAGTAFLVNTYGLHKGLAPTRHERLVFVVQYSLLPIGLNDYQPVPWEASLPGPLDAYVNRLYIRR